MNPAQYFFAKERCHIEEQLLQRSDTISKSDRHYLLERLDILNQVAMHANTIGDAVVELQYMLGKAEHEQETIGGFHWRERMAAGERVDIIRELYQQFTDWI